MEGGGGERKRRKGKERGRVVVTEYVKEETHRMKS